MKKITIISMVLLLIVFGLFIKSDNYLVSQSLNYINPEIREDGIYFHYLNSKARKIYLKSSFDEWTYRYAFYKKDDSVWELRLPSKDPIYQLKKGKYKYKLIVDGVSMYDRLNLHKEKNDFGIIVSILDVAYDLYDYSYSPLKVKDNVYRFFVFSNSNTLELAASFNNFVPEEMHKDEFRKNLFYRDVTLTKGIYYYSFINDGVWEVDRKNDSIVVDITGRKLSKTEIK